MQDDPKRKNDARRILEEQRQRKQARFSSTQLWAAAVLVLFLLFSNSIGRAFAHGLSFLPHEIGHTVVSWMLGRPAVPIFSTVGFYTAVVGDWVGLRLIFLGGWGYLLFHWCKLYGGVNLKRIVFAFVLLVFFFSAQARDVVISWMGSGGEIIAAFVLCYWALSPYCQTAVWKRYVYLMIGVVLYVNLFKFVGGLCFSSTVMDLYQQGTGLDKMTNDLHAVQQSLGISIKVQALFLGVLALLSLFVLWKLCQQPCNFFSEMWNRIKPLPPFSKFLELRSKSKKLF